VVNVQVMVNTISDVFVFRSRVKIVLPAAGKSEKEIDSSDQRGLRLNWDNHGEKQGASWEY